jgi:hypothetical protein
MSDIILLTFQRINVQHTCKNNTNTNKNSAILTPYMFISYFYVLNGQGV